MQKVPSTNNPLGSRLLALGLFDILGALHLVLICEEAGRILAKPGRNVLYFLPQLGHRLCVHIGLSDEFGKGYYK